MDPDSLLGNAYELISQLPLKKQPLWLQQTISILEFLNLNDILSNPHNISKDNLACTLKYRLKQKFINEWEIKIDLNKNVHLDNSQNGRKLRTYAEIKQCFNKEEYLNVIPSRSHRRHLSRLRTSSHKLGIETGRYKNIPSSERFCPFCPDAKTDDELHLITECTNNAIYRQALYDCAINSCTNFGQLSNKCKFIWILTSEDPNVIKALAHFVATSNCHRTRQINPWA